MITNDPSHLTSLFENSTEGIVLTNGKGGIVLINPAAQRMFGYNSAEIVGKPIEDLIPHRFKQNHVKTRDGFLHHPQNRIMGQGRDLFGKRKDDSEIPVEAGACFPEPPAM